MRLLVNECLGYYKWQVFFSCPQKTHSSYANKSMCVKIFYICKYTYFGKIIFHPQSIDGFGSVHFIREVRPSFSK